MLYEALLLFVTCRIKFKRKNSNFSRHIYTHLTDHFYCLANSIKIMGKNLSPIYDARLKNLFIIISPASLFDATNLEVVNPQSS